MSPSGAASADAMFFARRGLAEAFLGSVANRHPCPSTLERHGQCQGRSTRFSSFSPTDRLWLIRYCATEMSPGCLYGARPFRYVLALEWGLVSQIARFDRSVRRRVR